MTTGPARGYEIEGLSKLLRALEKLDSEANEDLKSAAAEAGQPVLDEARRQAPILTGRLRDSVRMVVSARAVKIRAGSPTRVPYAMPVHFGWPNHNIGPNLFMFRAVDAKQEEVLAVYQQRVIEIWNRAL